MMRSGSTGYRAKVSWHGQKVESLKDIIERDLDILFVGLNPTPRSVGQGHYFQGVRGKQFWCYMVRYGLMDSPRWDGYHDDLLLAHRFGITDLVKLPTEHAWEITEADLRHGTRVTKRKITHYRPRIVCAVFYSVAERLLGHSSFGYGRIEAAWKGSPTYFVLQLQTDRDHIDRNWAELLQCLEKARSDETPAATCCPQPEGRGKALAQT